MISERFNHDKGREKTVFVRKQHQNFDISYKKKSNII